MLANVLTLLIILCLLGICYQIGKRLNSKKDIKGNLLMGCLAAGAVVINITVLGAIYLALESILTRFIN